MIKPRWYQLEAIQSIFDYYEAGNSGNPLICAPCGTGKTVIIAGFMQKVLKMWPKQRFMVLTHVKELIVQNEKKLIEMWPTAPCGIYSSGLNQKDIMHPIIFGGCASVVNVVEAFGHRDLIIIDEAALVSPKEGTTYQNIIKRLLVINPYLKVIGLTATPYRLGQGMLTNEGLFTDIIFDMTDIKGFQRFIAEEFLCKLVPRPTETTLDCSDVRIGSNGDYQLNQLQESVDKKDITFKCLTESMKYCSDRKCWLVFCTGVEHAEHVSNMLNEVFNISTTFIHSKLPNSERDQRIADYKLGKYKCLCTNNMFTTGHDHPPIDFIIMLRPTVSPGLWTQMAGRGMRIFNGKEYCVLLDFAGNTARLGPINDVCIPKKKGKRPGEAPIKICPECGVYNHASVRVCDFCGFEFPKVEKLKMVASEAELIRGEKIVVEDFAVDAVAYNAHEGKSGVLSVKVTYRCGLRQFNQFVSPEHPKPYVVHKAHDWWRARSSEPSPKTVRGYVEGAGELRVPKTIKVWLNKRSGGKDYPEILSETF